MSDLQSKIAKNKAMQQPVAPVAEVPSEKEQRSYMQQFEQFSNEARKKAPEAAQTQDLDALAAKARELYDKKANRNEWLEVAQMLGKAVAQYGAAKAGASNVNMSNLQFQPGIDYSSRTDRAAKEYGMTTSELDRQRAEREKQQQGQERQYGKGEDTREGFLRFAAGREEAAKQRAEDIARQGTREKKEDTRSADAERRLQLQELTRQEQEARKQAQARQTLVNQLQQEGDLSSKSSKKLEEKYGQLAAAGDIDLAALKADLESKVIPGRIWDSPDEQKQAELLRDTVRESRNMLDAIRQKKQALLGLAPARPAAPTVAPQQPAQAQQPAGPKVGDIESGHQFLGGNPADPKNWKVVK